MVDYLLVFDVGTTGTKVLVFDSMGTLVEKRYKEYSLITPSQIEIEQKSEDWWNAIKVLTRDICKKSEFDCSKIKAIGITTQRGTIVPLDNNGNPLYNAITWMDTRNINLPDELREKLIQRTVTQKILWFKQNKPEIYSKAAVFASTDSYITKKLVDRFLITPSTAAYYPYSVSEYDWDEELISDLGLDKDKFPEVVMPGEKIGTLENKIAGELGLPADLDVIMGVGDQQASAVGLGVVRPYKIKATTGTGTFIDVVVDEPYFEFYEPTIHMFILPFLKKGSWLLEAVIPGTGAMLRWFRDNFAKEEVEQAEKEGKDPYDLITARASEIPPTSERLIVIPMFSFGRGVMNGLSFAHTKYHIARAILESNGYSIRFFLDMMTDSFELELGSIVIDGGGAKSDVWNQIIADITNKELLRTHAVEDAGALGAAILASVGSGIHGSIEEAISRMIKITKEYAPNNVLFNKYNELYNTFQELMLSAAAGLEV